MRRRLERTKKMGRPLGLCFQCLQQDVAFKLRKTLLDELPRSTRVMIMVTHIACSQGKSLFCRFSDVHPPVQVASDDINLLQRSVP